MGFDPLDYGALYIQHRHTLAASARRLLTDPRDVDEVVQDAYLRMFLALPELETELQALAYVRRTVVNLCIDRIRADSRRPRLVDIDQAWDLLPVEPADDAALVLAEDASIVRAALARLTPLHRAALIKREIEEKSLPEIAVELGVDAAQVKHLLHRARRALRRILVGDASAVGGRIVLDEVLSTAQRRLASTSPGQRIGAALGVIALLFGGGWAFNGGSARRVVVQAEPAPSVGRELVVPPPVTSLVRPKAHRVPRHLVPAAPPAMVSGRALPAGPPTVSGPANPGGEPGSAGADGAGQRPTAPRFDQPALFLAMDGAPVGGLRLTDRGRYADPDGTGVTFRLATTDPYGPSARQTVVVRGDGVPAQASVNLLLPYSGGDQIGYLLDGDDAAPFRQPDGTWMIRIRGVARALATEAGAPAQVFVDVQTVYSADLTRILDLRVTISAPRVDGSSA